MYSRKGQFMTRPFVRLLNRLTMRETNIIGLGAARFLTSATTRHFKLLISLLTRPCLIPDAELILRARDECESPPKISNGQLVIGFIMIKPSSRRSSTRQLDKARLLPAWTERF